jgi:hypothetical protein
MRKITLFIASLITCIFAVNAQSYHIIPESGGNPRNLNNDLEWPQGGGLPAGWTTVWSGTNSAARWSNVVALPFAFELNGQLVTHFKASTTGVVTFDTSATTVPTEENQALPHTSIPNNSICVWGMRPIARTFTTGLSNYILTRTFGTAPNRQFWIYYNSFGEVSIQAGLTYFSIVLEESTNLIHIVDQKTQCVTSAGGTCSNRTSLTLGVQIDSTNALMVTGSPNYQHRAGTGTSVDDNHYFTFNPGSQVAVDVRGQTINIGNDLSLTLAPFNIEVVFRNVGSAIITEGEFKYSINDGTPVSTTLSGLNVASLATHTATATTKWQPSDPGKYTIKAWIENPNGTSDEITSNDTVIKVVNVWENFVVRKSLHEVFSSSTCPPCRPGNIRLNEILDQRTNLYTTIKYQYNFPSPGDPYFTAEAQARGNYYGGVSSVPTMMVDGQWKSNPGGYTLAIFDSYQSKPSFVKIEASQQIDAPAQKISISATITPLNNLPANAFIRVAIVERLTTRNIKNNGETEFKHVLKKFVPGTAGERITNLSPNSSRTFNYEYTFPGTYRLPTGASTAINLATEHSVEEFDDLIGVIFVQDDDTKEVLQSEWSSVAPISSVKNHIIEELGLTLFPNPAAHSFTLKLNENVSGLIKITDMTGRMLISTSINGDETTIDCSGLNNGFYFVEIEANGKKAVKKLNIAH